MVFEDYFGLVDFAAPIGHVLDGYQIHHCTDEILVSLLDSPHDKIVIYDLYANYSKSTQCDCCLMEKDYNSNYQWTGYLLRQLSLHKLVILVRSPVRDYFTSLATFSIDIKGNCIKSIE